MEIETKVKMSWDAGLYSDWGNDWVERCDNLMNKLESLMRECACENCMCGKKDFGKKDSGKKDFNKKES